MKGEKIVTNLIPYGPEKPRSGMVKGGEGNPGTHQVDIFWDPPKGDFTKYFLNVEKVSHKNFSVEEMAFGNYMIAKPTGQMSILAQNNILNLNSSLHGTSSELAEEKGISAPVRLVQNLSNRLTTYTILGLQPGEKYAIELGTITGEVYTRQSITDIVLTKPLPPCNVCVSHIRTTSFNLNWVIPEAHTCLKGFVIKVKLDMELVSECSIPKNNTSFTIKGLTPGKDYDVFMTSLCTAEGNRKTESDIAHETVTTSLEKVVNLTMEEATSNTITVKWDPVFVSERLKYRLKIEAVQDEQVWVDSLGSKIEQIKRKVRLEREGINFEEEKDKVRNFTRTVKAIAGDAKSHEFLDLPDYFGAGFPYVVTIVATCKTPKGKEAVSDAVASTFQTKPYPPSKLEVENRNIQWSPSLTPHVNEYHISWTQIGINGSIVKSWTTEVITKDIRIPVTDAKQICRLPNEYDHHFCAGYIFQFEVSAVVSIKSFGIESESEGLCGTFIVAENGKLEPYTERPDSRICTNISDEII